MRFPMRAARFTAKRLSVIIRPSKGKPMRVKFVCQYFVAAGCLLAAQPVLATNEPSQNSTDSAKSVKTRDPNRTICETSLETGSRLAKRRVCMTAAEWDERRRQDRQLVDRAQVQRSFESPN